MLLKAGSKTNLLGCFLVTAQCWSNHNSSNKNLMLSLKYLSLHQWRKKCLTDSFHSMWRETCALVFVSLELVTRLGLAGKWKTPSSRHWLPTASKQKNLSTKKTNIKPFLTSPTWQLQVHVDLTACFTYIFQKKPPTCLLENFSLWGITLCQWIYTCMQT